MAGGRRARRGSCATRVTKVGEVIASAAATVMAAFAALLVASLESLRTLAPGLIVGVALMLLAALTLVPAIFSLLGIDLFWPTTPRRRHRPPHPLGADRRHGGQAPGHGAGRLGRRAGRLWPSGRSGFKTTYNQLAELPASTPSQAGVQHHGVGLPRRLPRAHPGVRHL